jgi:hypothetical protein
MRNLIIASLFVLPLAFAGAANAQYQRDPAPTDRSATSALGSTGQDGSAYASRSGNRNTDPFVPHAPGHSVDVPTLTY